MAATEHPRSTSVDVLGLVAFAIVVFIFLFVSFRAGTRAFGVSMVLGAVQQQFRGRIPYRWQGRLVSRPITGWFENLLNAAVGIVGLAIVIWPDVAMGFFGWDEQ